MGKQQMTPQTDLFEMEKPRLTVLSFGGGQDSTALLELYIKETLKKTF